jgi:hypothetical protein
MSQVTQQNATAGHPGDHGANPLAKAEALCRAVAGRDLGETPLYIVAQSTLPPGYYAGDHHLAFTLESLDIYLRDYIPNYRGRGPCMVMNDLALAELYEPEDHEYLTQQFALHELGHILDRPALFEDRTGVDPDKLLFEALVVADCTKRPPREDIPLYHGHEVGFIRIALHLCYRAQQAGFDAYHAALCAGYRYGLSHASLYLEALGDEPARCAGMLFRDIAKTKPPPAFSSLWCDDFIAYHQRFPLQKGSAP